MLDKKICENVLLSFLNYPISRSDEIFEKFAELPGAVYQKGEKPNERFLFVPGKKKDRVLLIAHTDTVWDNNYKLKDIHSSIKIVDGTVLSESNSAGIGADDRAGCAALWLLRDSGHSLLLIDGEENSHIGGSYIWHNNKMMKIFNNHRFVLSFDLSGEGQYLFHHVSNPKSFRKFIEDCGYKERPVSAGSDIFYICRKAAGVNVSIGYHSPHKPNESISIDSFYKCVNMATGLLDSNDKYYKTPVFIRIYKFIKHRIALIVKPLYKSLKQRVKND